MQRIRIVCLGMSPLALEIITSIVASESDMEVVRNIRSNSGLVDVAEVSNADVVILGSNDPVESANKYDALLYRHSHLAVIEIAEPGHHGSLYELRPRRVLLGELSPLVLLDAIRSSMKRTDEGVAAHEPPRPA